MCLSSSMCEVQTPHVQVDQNRAEQDIFQCQPSHLEDKPCCWMQAEIAERLVEFEWPDKSELSAAKLKEIEASVPIPERVWALKNVGATQAMSGPEGRARARQLLERAVGLKRELVGSAKHPGPPPLPP